MDPAWPPGDTQAQRWHLQPKGALFRNTPSDSQPSQFRYDPADPTPNAGGPINATLGRGTRGTGPQDNRKLEARRDVLTFTSQPLGQDIDVIGPVSAELFVE